MPCYLRVKLGPLNFRLRLSDLLADLTINLYRCISIQITNLLYFLLTAGCCDPGVVLCWVHLLDVSPRFVCDSLVTADRLMRQIRQCQFFPLWSKKCSSWPLSRVLPSTTFRSRRIVDIFADIVSYSRRKLVIDPVCQSYCLLLIDVYDPRLLTEICRQTKVIVLVSWCAWVSMRVVLLLYVDW